MLDKLKENLEYNWDHLLIDFHRQVNQVVFVLLPINRITILLFEIKIKSK